MNPRGRIAAALVATALLASQAGRAGADLPGARPEPFSLFEEEVESLARAHQPYLTGNWGGLRTKLMDLGITPGIAFVTDVLGNATGGMRRGLRQSNDLGLSVTADLERLARWSGASFFLSFSMRSGTDLSGEDIGNVFTVAEVCCQHTYRLVNVELTQSLFDDRLSVRGGRITAGDEFLTSPLYGFFVSEAFNGNPMGIFFNVPMTAYPVATWGLRVRVQPISQLSLMAGVYNGDPTLGDNDKHGVDWTMRGPPFAIGEVAWRLNQEPGATGLPGNVKVGGYFMGGEFPDLYRDVNGGAIALTGLPPLMHQGNGGFYVLVDQMVYRDGAGDNPRGLTPFATLLVAPSASVNTMPVFASGGVVFQGPWPSRPRDAAAFGVAYGQFSSQLARSERAAQSAGSTAGVQQYEIALELTYVIQATRWLQVQPDLQYIVKPGGTGKIPNALVLGFQLGITL